jgi:hypothetical protein
MRYEINLPEAVAKTAAVARDQTVLMGSDEAVPGELFRRSANTSGKRRTPGRQPARDR